MQVNDQCDISADGDRTSDPSVELGEMLVIGRNVEPLSIEPNPEADLVDVKPLRDAG
jgi:hypothetical protein